MNRLEKIQYIKSNRAFTPLYPERCDGFLNEWYADYEVARKHLEITGGYLLPYKTQFFICQREYIDSLGLNPDDADWELIGRDWIKPADHEAWQRLTLKLRKVEIHLTD
jgi:hypothetical protein